MSIEIERKFLVKDRDILIDSPHRSYIISQYYIDKNMRVRFITHSNDTDKAYITIKHKKRGIVRGEWEFEVAVKEAISYCEFIQFEKIGLGRIKKTRHIIDDSYGIRWEIDVFHDNNEGLILAEVELPYEGFEPHKLDCLGDEVTNDERYYNSYLAKHPYSEWK